MRVSLWARVLHRYLLGQLACPWGKRSRICSTWSGVFIFAAFLPFSVGLLALSRPAFHLALLLRDSPVGLRAT